jgi:hypothetical protein
MTSFLVHADRPRGKFCALELPIPLTGRMRHYLRRAPDDFTVYEAMCFSEVLGFGGEAMLARRIAKTRLGRDVSNPNFWRTVLRFFISNSDFPATKIGRALEFIQAMRFGGEEIPPADGCQRRPPFVRIFASRAAPPLCNISSITPLQRRAAMGR